ncbi:hypothetical protein [Mesorhizobium sp. B263B2A]|uniref:hypothetical protein n=1 Tax=Mesorhizobium sp. B263B2A TaxID=2876669 RepID=UPI001CD17386|nr:hypothetical protein [Mesorhizobium sp. B263B2A]MCA0030536.1 hypothetical protein [Mesorhizobium sp. B263B2A]
MNQKQRRSRSAMPQPYRHVLGFHHFKHEVFEHRPSLKMGGCQLEELFEYGMVQDGQSRLQRGFREAFA